MSPVCLPYGTGEDEDAVHAGAAVVVIGWVRGGLMAKLHIVFRREMFRSLTIASAGAIMKEVG